MNEHHQIGYILSCTVSTDNQLFSDQIQNILNQVCNKYGKHQSYLFVKDKKRKRTYLRQLCIFCMKDAGITNIEIAELFDLPRNTVWHHIRELNRIASVDKEVRAEMDALIFNDSERQERA